MKSIILMSVFILITGISIGLWRIADSGEGNPGGVADKGRVDLHLATFAGGCFWCLEADFEKLNGVVRVVSGYTGGKVENPRYEEVSAGITGHVEAVQVYYDPQKVSYGELLDYFWKHVDPTDKGGQFVDRGSHYRSLIFYHDEEQKRLAEESKREIGSSGRFDKPIATEIVPLGKFYAAEDYHQDYYKKNPVRYNFYRFNSGRDQFITRAWEKEMEESSGTTAATVNSSKPAKEDLKASLTALQYKVTQEEGTEPPFKNEYWDNKREGLYVDIVSGEPLFSSIDKFDSGTGWPSFTRPLDPENIVQKEDRKLFHSRTEVRSKHGDSHLGHVFPDGPPPTGLRYCINSAALRFIPREDLEKEGYGEYVKIFQKR